MKETRLCTLCGYREHYREFPWGGRGYVVTKVGNIICTHDSGHAIIDVDPTEEDIMVQTIPPTSYGFHNVEGAVKQVIIDFTSQPPPVLDASCNLSTTISKDSQQVYLDYVKKNITKEELAQIIFTEPMLVCTAIGPAEIIKKLETF